MIEYSLFSSKTLPSTPRNFKLVKISAKKAAELNALWHSRLPKIYWSNIVRNKNYICFGAYFEYTPFAVGIWSSPISNKLDFNSILELRRLAISKEAPKYTATWMISKMTKYIQKEFPNITKLISYQDTEVHTGTIYKASNWKSTNINKFNPWSNSRNRNKEQATGNKIRWEYDLIKKLKRNTNESTNFI